MITLIIKPDNGPAYRVTPDSRDIGKWEQRSPRNTLRRLGDNPSIYDHYSLAYVSVERQGIHELPSYEDFVARNAIEAVQESQEPLAYEELHDTIDKALREAEVTPAVIADAVVSLLDQVRMRGLEPDPTRPGR